MSPLQVITRGEVVEVRLNPHHPPEFFDLERLQALVLLLEYASVEIFNQTLIFPQDVVNSG